MPVFEAGVAEGTMSAGHVDVAAAAHAKLSDEVAREFAGHADNLVRRSQQLGVDDFDRECRDLARHLTSMHDRNAEVDELERQQAASSVKRWVDRGTGMCNTLISLDPLRDAKMWKVINHQVAHERQQRTSEGQQPLSFTALQAQAVVTAVTSGSGVLDGSGSGLDACSTSSASQRLPEISILCDLDTLITGIRATAALCETDDGVALPPDTVRRLACDAHIVPIVLGSTGEVLDQGRRARTATPAQRNTLAAMHQRCAFPGCTIGFSACKIHHVRWWWEHNGPTDIENLLPLCEKHHHLVHEGGWGLTLDAHRTATWTRPDSTVHHCGTTLDRRPRDVPLLR